MAARHIVWDWNGTLLDDLEVVIEAVNVSIGRLGRAPIDATEYRNHFTRPVRAFYDSMFGRPVTDVEWADLDHVFHQEYFTRVASAPLAADAVDAMDLASSWGWSQSLLSMSTHHRLLEVVGSHGLSERFVAIDGLTVPTGGLKLPHFQAHLERIGVDPGDAVVIGDTPDDVAAARALGAAVIAYDGGSHHRSDLEVLEVTIAGSLVEAVASAEREMDAVSRR